MSRERVSKLLSLVLRHRPDHVGVTLDDAGWIDVDRLLVALAAHGTEVTRAELEGIVTTSDKQRFAFSVDGLRIRANQGHSVEVALALEERAPPAELFHGTVARFLNSIREKGLLRGERHHVHLSASRETAMAVGARRGSPVLLTIDAAAMHADELRFFRSDNGVWLTDHVPARYLSF
jgi:putative RNA 2'-phosphotransferase